MHPDQWTYELKHWSFAPHPSNQPQWLGQLVLRQKPRFYLLCRYLVMCRNTGALHTYRFKHDSQVKTFFDDLKHPTALTMKRTDTPGYLCSYLHQVWQSNGVVRPGNAVLSEDAKQLSALAKREFASKNKDSLVICPEVE